MLIFFGRFANRVIATFRDFLQGACSRFPVPSQPLLTALVYGAGGNAEFQNWLRPDC